MVSAIWSPTGQVGSRLAEASWKIIATSSPRICRSSSSASPTISRPSTLMLPLTAALAGQQAHHRVGQRALAAAALADDAEDLAALERRATRRRRPAPAAPRRACAKRTPTLARVQDGAHSATPRGSKARRSPSPRKVKAEHRDDDREAREDLDPRRLDQHVAAVGQHAAERRRRRLRAEAEEAQAGLELQREGAEHRGLHDHRPERVGGDMADQHAQMAGAARAGAGDVVVAA